MEAKKTWDLELMEKYPLQFRMVTEYQGGPGHPIQMFGIETNKGWSALIEKMCADIDVHMKILAEPILFQWSQIKEKFGGGRFYYNGGDDVISKIVSDAENDTYDVCEVCGSRDDVGQTLGWITVICSNCLNANERMRNRRWYSNADMKLKSTLRKLYDGNVEANAEVINDFVSFNRTMPMLRRAMAIEPETERARHDHDAKSGLTADFEYAAVIAHMFAMAKSGYITINELPKNFSDEEEQL